MHHIVPEFNFLGYKSLFRFFSPVAGYLLFGFLILNGLYGCGLSDSVPGNEITDTQPAHGETDVATDTTISISFEKPAVPSHFEAWILTDVAFDESWSSDNTTVVLTPSMPLLESTAYLVTIERVSFTDGSFLSDPVSFSFTTTGEDLEAVPLAASPENEETVATISDDIDQLLMSDADLETVYARVVETLEDDPRVEAAGTDPDSNTIWIEFVDGEHQIFEIIDDTLNDQEQYPDGAVFPTAASVQADDHLAIKAAYPVDPLQQDGELPSYHLPESKKALLANGIKYFHKNWIASDSTDIIETMLKQRGYEVDRKTLTIDDFKKLGDYGVILIETHGSWRTFDTITALTCDGGQQVLLTTTPVTGTNPPVSIKNSDTCSALVVWTTKKKHKTAGPGGTAVFTKRFYGVTADYVRAQVSGFSDNTVFALGACRGIGEADDATTYSPFRDVVFEKSKKGAVFIGWNNKAHNWESYQAMVNLFQYATASNDSVSFTYLDKSGTWKKKTFLESFDVPWGGIGMTVQGAFSSLQMKLYHYSPTTGASLILDSQKGGSLLDTSTFFNILMPHPLDLAFMNDCTTTLMNIYAAEKPQVTVGGTAATVTRQAEGGYSWKMDLPAALSGDLIVTENGRTSIPRTVHLWEPVINIQLSEDILQVSTTLKLKARATVDSLSFRNFAGDDVPRAGFLTYFDCKESTYSWQVSGEGVNENGYVKFSGSGSRSLGEDQANWFQCLDGKTAQLGIFVPIEVTTTIKDLETGDSVTFTSYTTAGFDRSAIPVSSDWTIAAQAFTTSEYSGSQTISWDAFSPLPAFSSSVEPR